MKKKAIIIGVIILAFLMLVPFPMRLKDGGSVRYTAILYKVTDVHRMTISENGDVGFMDGLTIEIFGVEVYNNLKQ
ncbi:MAG: hypothetical protein E7597_03435 [Ruminococcaceae bacterium]|nr:hypothetical protein [Oscillospiraceae bacterium]